MACSALRRLLAAACAQHSSVQSGAPAQEANEAAYSSVVGARTALQLQAYASLPNSMYVAILPMVQGYVQRGPLQFLSLLLHHQVGPKTSSWPRL